MARQVYILLIFLLSCSNNNSTKYTTQSKDTAKSVLSKLSIAVPKRDTSIKLDFFNSVPDTISGCGEYFAYDTNTVKKDRYIFLSNLTSFAIIKIDGKDIYLNMDSTVSKEINDEMYIAVYKNQNYKAVLTVKKSKTYDEGGFYTGTLEIISDKINTVFKVHGESGC
jgi:hypothetical protein